MKTHNNTEKAHAVSDQDTKFSALHVVLMVIIVLLELNCIFFINSRMLIRRNSEISYNSILKVEKSTLKSAVDNTVRDIESTRMLLESQGETDEEVEADIQNRMYAKIHSDQYDDGRYMWINKILNYNGGDDYAVRLIHPNPTSSEGMMLSTETKDAEGEKPYQTELDLIKKSGGGFYTYSYQPDENTSPVEKITYCAYYKDYDWVICEGVNLSSIHDYETSQKKLLLPHLYHASLIMSLVCMVITLFTTWGFASRYNRVLVRKNKELNDMAYGDFLTGLYNRGGLIRQLDTLIHEDSTRKLTGMFIDLDDFKLINDLYGHIAGDEALRHLADFLRQSFPDAVIGRTGGDEFCVVIRNKSPEECSALLEQVIPGEKKFSYNGQTIRYTISGGYADYPSQAVSREELMSMMDSALYAAKIGGKNSVRHFRLDMTDIKRDALGFNVKNMAMGLPGAFLIYRAEGDEEILFANDHLIRLFECDDYEDFLKYTQSSFRHIVFEEDLDRVEELIRKQIEQERSTAGTTQDSYDDYVEYRIQTKTGKIRTVIDMGRLVDDVHYGEIFYVFILDVEKLNREHILESLSGMSGTPERVN